MCVAVVVVVVVVVAVVVVVVVSPLTYTLLVFRDFAVKTRTRMLTLTRALSPTHPILSRASHCLTGPQARTRMLTLRKS